MWCCYNVTAFYRGTWRSCILESSVSVTTSPHVVVLTTRGSSVQVRMPHPPHPQLYTCGSEEVWHGIYDVIVVVGRRVGGYMYNRQRCSEMWESLIHYSKIVRGGWFLISFIDVPAKKITYYWQCMDPPAVSLWLNPDGRPSRGLNTFVDLPANSLTKICLPDFEIKVLLLYIHHYELLSTTMVSCYHRPPCTESTGRGTCDCPSGKCVCSATGPISGRLYTGDLCECNPDACFNTDYPNVRVLYTYNVYVYYCVGLLWPAVLCTYTQTTFTYNRCKWVCVCMYTHTTGKQKERTAFHVTLIVCMLSGTSCMCMYVYTLYVKTVRGERQRHNKQLHPGQFFFQGKRRDIRVCVCAYDSLSLCLSVCHRGRVPSLVVWVVSEMQNVDVIPVCVISTETMQYQLVTGHAVQ